MTEQPHLTPPAAVAQLVDVRLLELESRLLESLGEPATEPTTDGDQDDFRVGIRVDWDEDDRLLRYVLFYDIRRETTDSSPLSLRATYALTFGMPQPFDGEPHALHEFGRTTVAMAAQPFVRHLLATLAAEMSVSCAPLPLLRIGDLSAVPGDTNSNGA